ncbi:MAG: helix-turn-helix domain-containing protein [Cyanobacteria bacterium J06632_3]
MSQTILVIEDEAQTRNLFLRCLAFERFIGIGAENGHDGIKLATQYRPDLIVCDIMMPDVDGYEVLSALRDEQQTASIPFIFLTAKVTMAELRRGMTSGADDYLTKPCTVEEFLAAITARLERHEALKGLDSPSGGAPVSSTDTGRSSIFPDCPRLALVFSFIEANYQQPIQLTDVAQAVGYSPAYLTNLSQSQTGKTVKTWIIERRMTQARQMLLSSAQSIRQIAEAVGYADAGYFTRQFRKMYGTTPQKWRTARNS